MSNIANTSVPMEINIGAHWISISDFWDPSMNGNRYTFQYYDFGNGTTSYSPTSTINVQTDTTITAHFTKPLTQAM